LSLGTKEAYKKRHFNQPSSLVIFSNCLDLFIYDLLNDAANNSDYIVESEKEVVGISPTSQKNYIRIAGIRVEV
jgi:hypothetical protein